MNDNHASLNEFLCPFFHSLGQASLKQGLLFDTRFSDMHFLICVYVDFLVRFYVVVVQSIWFAGMLS